MYVNTVILKIFLTDVLFVQEFVFKKHIQQAHSLSPEEYTNNYGSPALSIKLHKCKVGNQMQNYNNIVGKFLRLWCIADFFLPVRQNCGNT
jgi:hypothetical protein